MKLLGADAEADAVRQAALGLGTAIDQLALPKPKQRPRDAAGTFLDELRQHAQRLQAFNDYPRRTPYLNRKNRRDLYVYVTRLLDQLLATYRAADATTTAIAHLAGNQTTRIAALHATIQTELAKVPATLATIHPDASCKAFTQRMVTEKLTPLQALGQAFTSAILPRLQARPRPPAVLEAGQAHFEGVRMLLTLHRYNQAPAGRYAAVKVVQQRLANRLPTLARLQASAAAVPAPQQQRLQALYGQLAALVPAAQQKTQTFASKNSSQQKGATQVGTFLGSQVGTAVAGVVAGLQAQPGPVLAAPKVHQLWVRIFPDDIFIRTHEPDLTANEVSLGQQFWRRWWAASHERELELGAWRTLCQALGAPRAAWVARQLDPRRLAGANQQHLLAPPSRRVAEATRALQTQYDSFLKPLPLTGSDGQLFGALVAAKLTATAAALKQASQALAGQATEQVFFYQQLQTILARSRALLFTLVDRAQSLPPAKQQQWQAQAAGVAQLWNNLGEVQKRFDALRSVSADDLLAALPELFEWPAVATKNEHWTAAPTADLLPDRFVVATMQGSTFTHIVVGEPVPESLLVGLDPSKFDQDLYKPDEHGNLLVDPALNWLTDYPTAVQAGMGITVPLTAEQAKTGFDRVLVLGVKNLAPNAARQRLESLLESHLYAPDGLDFLKVGTPTNNTRDLKTPYQRGSDVDERFALEIEEKRFAPVSQPFAQRGAAAYAVADGQWLSAALGIQPAVLQRAPHSRQTQIGNALATNRALWHGTMGHYMEEMWDHLATYDNIRRTESFFLPNCLGRGFLPSVRVGSQPYGVLPTTAFSRFQPIAEAELPPLSPQDFRPNLTAPERVALEATLQKRYDQRLWDLLQYFRSVWQKLLTEHVKHFGNLNDGDYQQNFIAMLGLHATSLEEYVRYAVNAARGPQAHDDKESLFANTNFQSTDDFGPEKLFAKVREHLRRGVFEPSFSFKDAAPVPPVGIPFWQVEDSTYSRLRNQVGDSRIYQARFLEPNPQLTGPTVAAGALSATDPVPATGPGSYLNWLLGSRPDQLLADNRVAQMPSDSLLFLLLRQSLMQAYQEAALVILQQEGLVPEVVRRQLGSNENYLTLNIFKGKVFSTKWHFLLRDLDDVNGIQGLNFAGKPFYNYMLAHPVSGHKSLGNYVYPTTSNPLFKGYSSEVPHPHQPAIDKVNQVRAALEALGQVPTAELDTLLAEHIDLNTYRLDAWLLGFVNRRLAEQRAREPLGVLLGAFGWVENLRPDLNRTLLPTQELPDALRDPTARPVYHDPDNEGFIHAPSINHAIAAAVLRSAYKANRQDQGAGSRLAINLSSERVRMALQLLDGLQHGLEMGAVLGFQFERGLHERYLGLGVELDEFIQPLRKQYPLTVPVGEAADNHQPDYQSQVLNGQALLKAVLAAVHWDDLPEEIPLRQLLTRNNFAQCPPLLSKLTGDKKKLTAIISEVDRMADAFDALGDLVMSESVYQIVQGNHVRAAAVLESLGKGRAMQTPQIIDTPRTGTVVTQRVLWQLPVATAPAAGWGGAAASLRATAEPALNAYLGQLLGPAAGIRCVVRVQAAPGPPPTATPAPVDTFTVSVADLKWQPIDYFYHALDQATLAQAVQYFVRQQHSLPDITTVQAQLGARAVEWEPAVRTFYELDYLLTQLRKVLGNARATGADDFLDATTTPDKLNPGQHQVAELDARIRPVLKAYQTWQTDFDAEPWLQPLLAGTKSAEQLVLTDVSQARIIALLGRAQAEGVPNAIPVAFRPDATGAGQPAQSRLALLRQLLDVQRERAKRAKAAEQLLAALPADASAAAQVAALTGVARALFGKQFLVLPRYQLSNAADLLPQLAAPFDAATGLLRHGGPLAMSRFLARIGRVRTPLYAFELLGLGVEALGGPRPPLLPAQLPAEPGAYWLGSDYPADYQPATDKLSLVVANAALLSEPVQVGLLVDEWVEVIPNPRQTTGLVYNYDQPNATPPQTLLLAVCPTQKARWDWDDLLYTLIDTLELAKLRAVEPDHLEQSELAHVLPAVVAETMPDQIKSDQIMKNLENAMGVQVVVDFADNK